ncbi:MAG TPA: hypothetical protein DEQ20_02160 [Desulfobulbaceae bacterium]|nr:MAG: hypothetical protein A2520_03745 [Deltaproteobacteria bacterium RIFOXYD12_FULL_53_23]HCC53723.1 hypothetical protein [Desulfobulbaceae bacterium]
MSNRSVYFFSTLIGSSFISIFMLASFSFAGADDNAKLKALENAVTSPAASGMVKKPRTRAIVFDNEPQTGGGVATPATEPTQEPGKQATAPEMNCNALPTDVATTAVDFAIQFKVASAVIAPASEPILGQIAKILALAPNKCILVEGHTDTTGNADKNLKLSRDRADSVVQFMVEKTGMGRNRFVPVGKGSSDLLKNVSPTDPAHRRVVFKIVG